MFAGTYKFVIAHPHVFVMTDKSLLIIAVPKYLHPPALAPVIIEFSFASSQLGPTSAI